MLANSTQRRRRCRRRDRANTRQCDTPTPHAFHPVPKTGRKSRKQRTAHEKPIKIMNGCPRSGTRERFGPSRQTERVFTHQLPTEPFEALFPRWWWFKTITQMKSAINFNLSAEQLRWKRSEAAGRQSQLIHFSKNRGRWKTITIHREVEVLHGREWGMRIKHERRQKIVTLHSVEDVCCFIPSMLVGV